MVFVDQDSKSAFPIREGGDIEVYCVTRNELKGE